MNTAKVLIPNKEWVVTENSKKVGAITKDKKGYQFLHKGKAVGFKNLNDLKTQLGIELFEESVKKKTPDPDSKNYVIYDFPCSSKPYESVYSVKEKLPFVKLNGPARNHSLDPRFGESGNIDFNIIHENVKKEYGVIAENNPVALYNNNRLYKAI